MDVKNDVGYSKCHTYFLIHFYILCLQFTQLKTVSFPVLTINVNFAHIKSSVCRDFGFWCWADFLSNIIIWDPWNRSTSLTAWDWLKYITDTNAQIVSTTPFHSWKQSLRPVCRLYGFFNNYHNIHLYFWNTCYSVELRGNEYHPYYEPQENDYSTGRFPSETYANTKSRCWIRVTE